MKRYNRKKNIRWNTMKILVTGFFACNCDRSSSFMASGQQPEAD